MDNGATFSQCGKYRYSLWRIWDTDKPFVMFIGLNPSTADEKIDDPTIRRCIGFSKGWDYGGLYMTNIFAFRQTDPEQMKLERDPVGESNDLILTRLAGKAGIVIAAWGIHGSHMNRDVVVKELIKPLYCLGTTKNGSPKHPLYLKRDLAPIPY